MDQDILITLKHLQRLIQYIDSKSFSGEGGTGDIVSDLVAEATVDDTSGEPTVKVTKSVVEGVVKLLFAFTGLRGESGVYVGSGDMPEGVNLQIDPEGDDTEIADGVTFFPEVSEEGDISWTNNGNLENPETVNIKGPQGKSAYELAQDAGFGGSMSEWLQSLVGTIVDLTDVSASVDNNSGIPSVEVEVGGTETEKSIKFIFKNLKGTKGDKGDKGNPGDIGITPNLQIGSVVTLSAGQRATAEIEGFPEEPILNLGIPTGSRGYTPIRGIDYYTQADKEFFMNEIISTFLGGYKLDVSNTIPPEEEDDGKTITFVFPD